MNSRWSFLLRSFSILLLMSFLSLGLAARAKAVAPSVDEEYISALAAADRFMHAWQTQDEESGLVMLTDEVKQHVSEERLEEFFSPGSNSLEAYEVRTGKKLNAQRYAFPVVLFSITAGAERKWIQPRLSQIIVVRTGSEDWAIDKLP